MRRLVGRYAFVWLLFAAMLATNGCKAADAIECEVSGRVVIAGQQTPLPNQEVEVWVFKPPFLPLGMGKYVKVASTKTDASGAFKVSAQVPRDEMFELRTRNSRTVLGGGLLHLRPAPKISGVTIVHDLVSDGETENIR